MEDVLQCLREALEGRYTIERLIGRGGMSLGAEISTTKRQERACCVLSAAQTTSTRRSQIQFALQKFGISNQQQSNLFGIFWWITESTLLSHGCFGLTMNSHPTLETANPCRGHSTREAVHHA